MAKHWSSAGLELIVARVPFSLAGCTSTAPHPAHRQEWLCYRRAGSSTVALRSIFKERPGRIISLGGLQVQPAPARRGGERTGWPLLDSRTNGSYFGRSSTCCQGSKIHGTLLVRTAEEGFARCFIAGCKYSPHPVTETQRKDGKGI
jgi:hypothetical protein